jgi:phosphate transport system protein
MPRRLIDRGLKDLAKMILEMSLYSYASFEKAKDAIKRGRNIRSDLIARSYQLMMKREEINSLAIELIARYQPLASDLRYLKAIMETAYNLLRIGRYSADISVSVSDYLIDNEKCDSSILNSLIEKVDDMLQLTLDIIEHPDAEKAEKIYFLDEAVDDEYRKVLENILNINDVKCGLALALIARYLERLGDHCYYIADSIYYYLNGYRLIRKW